MMSAAGWESHDHQMGGDDDFGNFLDIPNIGDGMQFDFNGFQDGSGQQPQQHMMNRQREHADTMMGESTTPSMMPQSSGIMHNQNDAMSSAGPSNQMMATSGPSSDSISTIDAQIHYLQQQKFHQQQRALHDQRTAYFSHNSVPPTPQSIEIPPGSGHFYSQQEVYERNYHHQQRMKEQQDMAFTPLVSPAVTPLDPQFSMENAFTVPGAYFSPLTSPALHAQNDSGYDHSTHSNNSPIEMDLETGPTPVASTLELSKKARKNNAAKSRSKAGVKSSPISKPQRKKIGPSPAIVSQVLSEVDERNASQTAESNLLPLPAASTDGSEENASVSPENLTDMPPPPVPAWKSTSKSPYMQAQNGGSSTSVPTTMTTPTSITTPTAGPEQLPHPATPASLMRLPATKSKQPMTAQHEQTATDNIESLELPESVSKKQFAPIDTTLTPRESPRIEPSSAKSSSSKPMPSPSLRRRGTASASQSPQIRPGSTGPSARKTPQLAPRTGRKGSVQVSPALLPRISPNIKPLLPSGGDSAESDASRLLTSKSNYQNILEGNTVPGVTYPSELSSNLTSKRTSHKIAEQGRRNRINSALQIMANLLPDHQKTGSGDGEDSDKKDGKQPNASNSKASVVEKAIVHMQHLEQENVGLKKELEDLKEQMEKLKEPSCSEDPMR